MLKYFDIIKKNAHLLKYMINDIIDYAKISKNQLNINPSSFSLDLVVNVNFKPYLKEVMELLRLQA